MDAGDWIAIGACAVSLAAVALRGRTPGPRSDLLDPPTDKHVWAEEHVELMRHQLAHEADRHHEGEAQQLAAAERGLGPLA
jgi:hypothetical protein